MDATSMEKKAAEFFGAIEKIRVDLTSPRWWGRTGECLGTAEEMVEKYKAEVREIGSDASK